MVSFKEGIKNYFDNRHKADVEQATENAIQDFALCGNVSSLNTLYNGLKEPYKSDTRIIAAYNARKAELDAQGMHTATDQALGIFKPLPNALYSGFAELGGKIQDALEAMISANFKLGTPELAKIFDAASDEFIESLLKNMAYGGVSLTDAKVEELKEALKPFVSMGLTFTVSSVLAELIHPTKEMGFSGVSHFLRDTFGFKELWDAYIRPAREAIVEERVRHDINSIVQPYLPTEGELTGLARKYEITMDDYKDAMKKLGIQQKYIDALYSGFWADPRLFEILRLMEVARPTPTPPEEAKTWLTKAGLSGYIGPNWWLAMKFGKAGYDMIDIPVLIQVVRARYLQKELGDIRTMQRNLYKDGELSRSDYEAILTKRGVSAEEAKEHIDAIDRELLEEANKVYRSAYEKKYAYGRITVDELKEALKKHGLCEGRLDARVEYLTTLKAGKLAVAEEEIKDLTDTQILRSYRLGKKEKGWAIKRIDDKGYTTEDAALLVDTEEKGIIDDEDAEFIRAYEQRCRYGRMTIDELKKKYLEHGKSERWAEGRALYIEEVILGRAA